MKTKHRCGFQCALAALVLGPLFFCWHEDEKRRSI